MEHLAANSQKFPSRETKNRAKRGWLLNIYQAEVIVKIWSIYGIKMWPGSPPCLQCAVQTPVRMTARVDWSRPPARKCVTADVATADRTVALVSKRESQGYSSARCVFLMYACLYSACVFMHVCVRDNGLMNGGRWRHERAAKLVFSCCKRCR